VCGRKIRYVIETTLVKREDGSRTPHFCLYRQEMDGNEYNLDGHPYLRIHRAELLAESDEADKVYWLQTLLTAYDTNAYNGPYKLWRDEKNGIYQVVDDNDRILIAILAKELYAEKRAMRITDILNIIYDAWHPA
jgi:hypothetical protein